MSPVCPGAVIPCVERILRMKARRSPHQNTTVTSTRDSFTKMVLFETAIAAIESLDSLRQFAYTRIVKKYSGTC